MRILNETKKIVLSEDAAYARSFYSRALGLMLSKKKDLILVSPNEDVVSSTIHMALMRYSIDVVWVDSEKKVVDVRKNIPPLGLLRPATWRTYAPKKAAKYVIELGRGCAEGTETGDEISFSGGG